MYALRPKHLLIGSLALPLVVSRDHHALRLLTLHLGLGVSCGVRPDTTSRLDSHRVDRKLLILLLLLLLTLLGHFW